MDTNASSTSSKPTMTSYVDSFKRFFGGVHFQFPQFIHDHPAVMDVNRSWRFIIIQSCALGAWLMLNSLAFINHWDN